MKSRGRPCRFDREKALEQIMQIFWARGFEETQISDLTAALAINPPSFYAAFGSKEAAFRRCVEHYTATIGQQTIQILNAEQNAITAVRAMLLKSIDIIFSNPQGKGCMLILGLVNGAVSHPALHSFLAEHRQHSVTAIEARLKRGITEGDLPTSANTTQLAHYFGAILQALSLQARDGADRKTLQQTVEFSLHALS